MKTFLIYFTSFERTLRNCVRVARQTLTLFVWVQILVPQPEKSTAAAVLFSMMCSAARNVMYGAPRGPPTNRVNSVRGDRQVMFADASDVPAGVGGFSGTHHITASYASNITEPLGSTSLAAKPQTSLFHHHNAKPAPFPARVCFF